MPQRHRSHQLEDRSRHAFARLLPSAWTAERMVPDYGLDLRVEIFDDTGRPTGRFFFVQLKSTAAGREGRGVTVRLRPDHLDYWNSLPVPTMVALWVEAIDTVYWRWAHLHHPWPRPREPKMESFRLEPSDRWNASDPAAIEAEVTYCGLARADALRTPIEVHLESHRSRPLSEEELRAFVETWAGAVDHRVLRLVAEPRPDQCHLELGQGVVRVRVGRAILSFTDTTEDRKALAETPAALLFDALAVLGLVLGGQGNPRAGLDVLQAHGKRSRLLARLSSPEGERWGTPPPSLHVLLTRTGRYDIGLDIAEAWAAAEHDHFQAGVDGLLAWLKFNDAEIAPGERRRLDDLVRSRPRVKPLLAPEVRTIFADAFRSYGSPARARDQYASIAADYAKQDDVPDAMLERLTDANLDCQDYDAAAKWASKLVRRHPEDERFRMTLGVAWMFAGNYSEALLCFMSINQPENHGEAWARATTVALAAKEIEREQQLRQPSKAEEVARRLPSGADREAALALFHEAAAFDAISPNAWRLYFGAAFPDPHEAPYGPIGILPVAVLAWSDPEWWALAAHYLLGAGHVTGFVRAVECAITAIGPDFASRVADPEWRLHEPKMAPLIEQIAALKAAGKAIDIPDETVSYEGKDLAVIIPAEPGYRLFDVDLPPVEEWFRDED